MKSKVIQITNQKKQKKPQMKSQKDIIRITNKRPIYNQRSQDFHFEHKTENSKPIYFFNIYNYRYS